MVGERGSSSRAVKAARGHCPHAAQEPAHPHLRRGHQRAGFGQRTRHPGRAAKRRAEQDHAADCPPPSTVVDAHEILVMDAGRIIERGTHAQLLAPGRPLRQHVGLGNKAMAPPDSLCIWNLEPMKPVPFCPHFCRKNTAPRWPRCLKRSTRPMQRRLRPRLLNTARACGWRSPSAIGLSPAQIDALPALTLICVLGAGENVAVDHAKAGHRGGYRCGHQRRLRG